MDSIEILQYDICFQEVPDEISLCFSICGCTFRCPGCSTPELQAGSGKGKRISLEQFKVIIDKYKNNISNVIFLGGEHLSVNILKKYFKLVRDNHLKITLYTGMDIIPEHLTPYIDYIKYGSYNEKLGPLNKETTNQRMINLQTNEDITYKFWKNATPTFNNYIRSFTQCES